MKRISIILFLIICGVQITRAQCYLNPSEKVVEWREDDEHLGHNVIECADDVDESTIGDGSSVLNIRVNGEEVREEDMHKYGFYLINYTGTKRKGGKIRPDGYETLGDVLLRSMTKEGEYWKANYEKVDNYPPHTQQSSIQARTLEGVYKGIGLLIDNSDFLYGGDMIYWEAVLVNLENGYCETTGLQTEYTEVFLNLRFPTEKPSLGPTFDVKDLAACWSSKFDLNEAVSNLVPSDAKIEFFQDEQCLQLVSEATEVGSATNPTADTHKAETTYWVKASSGEKSTIKSFKVTEYQAPEIELALADGVTNPVCQGAPVEVEVKNKNGFVAGTYSFKLQNTTQTDTHDKVSPKYTINSISVADVCTVEVTTGADVGKCKATKTLNINVQDLSPAVASNIQITSNPTSNAICKGENITLIASTNDPTVSFEWETPVEEGDKNKPEITLTPDKTTTYKVHGKIGSCVATTAKSIEVTVNEVPEVKITAPAAICAGNTVDLTNSEIVAGSTSGLKYTYWKNEAASETLADAKAIPGSGTYYIKGETKAGCHAIQPVNVTVHTLPIPQIEIAGGKTSVCSGVKLSLTAKPEGATYAWTGSSTEATQTIEPTIAERDNTFTVKITDNNKCSATSAPLVITGTPSPKVTIEPVDSKCMGATIALVGKVEPADAATSGTVLWTGNQLTATDALTTNATLPDGKNTYHLKVTNDKGCAGEAEVTVVGNHLTVDLTGNNGPTVVPGKEVVLRATAKLNNTATSNVTYKFEELSPNAHELANGADNSVTVTPSSTSKYKVTVTEKTLGCTATSAEYEVKVDAAPFIVTDVQGGTSICAQTDLANSPITLSVTASGGAPEYTYKWEVPEGMTVEGKDADTLKITAINYDKLTGNQVVSVTVSDKASHTETKSATIQINALPTVLIAGKNDGENYDACQGVALNLKATIQGGGNGTFTWEAPASVQGKTDETVSINVTDAKTETYTVAVVDGNQCKGEASLEVTVNALPEVQLAVQANGQDVKAVCPNTEITLTASSGSIRDPNKYSWSGAASDMKGKLTGTRTPTGTETYIVSVNDGKCNSKTKQVEVSVYTPGVLTVTTPSQTVCPGSEVVLTATGGKDYTWTGTPEGQKKDNTLTVTLGDAHNSYTYTVNGKDEHDCPAKEGTITINMAPMPGLVLAKATLDGCTGSEVDLWAAVDRKTVNEGTNLKVFDNQNTELHNTKVSTDGTYPIALSAGACSTEAKEVTVKFHALPQVLLAVKDGKDAACSGETITLTATSSDAVAPQYIWEDKSTGATKEVVLANNGSSDLKKTYTVTAQNTYCSNETKTTVTIKPLPKVEIKDPGTVCASRECNLVASGADTYVWEDQSTEANRVVVPTLSNHEYSVVGTGTNGCQSAAVKINLTVKDQPALSIGNLTPVCAGQELRLKDAVLSTGFTLEYFGPDADDKKLDSDRIKPEKSATYYVQGTPADGGCPTEKYQIRVEVKPIPTITISGEKELCQGTSTELTAKGGVSYTWEDPAESKATIQVTPERTRTYKVIGKDASGCSAEAEIEVTVHPLPELAWKDFPGEATEGTSVTIATSLKTATTAPYEYTWSKPDGQESNKGASCTIAQATPPSMQFAVKVKDKFGCESAVLKQDLQVTPVGGELAVNLQYDSQTICKDGMQQLTAKASHGTPAYTYRWLKNDVEIQGETGATLIVTEAAKYKVEVTDQGTTKQTQTAEVEMTMDNAHTAPVVTIENQQILSNSSTVMVANVKPADTDCTYAWSGELEDGNSSDKKYPMTAQLTKDKHEYQLYVTDKSKCKSKVAKGTVEAMDEAFHVLASAARKEICIGNTNQFGLKLESNSMPAESDLSYEWRPTDGLSNIRVKDPVFTASAAGIQEFVVKVSDKSNHTAFGYVTFSVMDQKAPVLELTDANKVSCVGSEVSVVCKSQETTVKLETYKWFINGKQTKVGVVSQRLDSAGHYTVKVTAEGGNTCLADTVEMNYEIHESPTIEWDPLNVASAEAGTNVTIKAIANKGQAGDYTYTWNSPKTGTPKDSIYTLQNIQAATTFKVQVKDNQTGCSSPEITTEVTIRGADVDSIEIEIRDTAVCKVDGQEQWIGLPVKVTSAHTDVTYAWKAVGGNNLPLTDQTKDTARVNIAGADAGNYTFTVMITDKQHAENVKTAELVLKINPVPALELNKKELAAHPDEQFQLKVVNPTDYDYIWAVSSYDMDNSLWEAGGEGNDSKESSLTGVMKDRDIRYVVKATDKKNGCTTADTAYAYRIPDAPKVAIDTADDRLSVKLNWNAVPGADDYTIWSRKWDPYCMLTTDEGTTYRMAVPQTTAREWKTQDMDTLEFYYITANRNIGGTPYRSLASDTMGYYISDINYDPSYKKNDTYVPVFFDFTKMGCPTSKEVYERLNINGGANTFIAQWNYEKQIVTSSTHLGATGASIKAFAITPGSVLQIKPSKACRFMQYGKLPAVYEFEIKNTNSLKNVNWCFVPLQKLDKLELPLLFSTDFTSVGQIARWNWKDQKMYSATNTPANVPTGKPEGLKPLKPLLFINISPRKGKPNFIWK